MTIPKVIYGFCRYIYLTMLSNYVIMYIEAGGDCPGLKNKEEKTMFTFDAKKVEGWSGIPICLKDAVVQLTNAAGITSVTKNNYLEYALRIKILERLYGVFIHTDKPGKEGDVHITAMDVWQFIGLSTNVSSKTRAQFMKGCKKVLECDAQWAINEELRIKDVYTKKETMLQDTTLNIT